MKIRIWAAALMVTVLTACAASMPRVYTDADHAADFGQYHSYAFFESAKQVGEEYGTLMGQRIEDAIAAKMAERGYVLDIHQPDMLINFHVKRTDKQRVRPATVYGGYGGYGGRYGSRSGMYMGWPGYVEPGYADSYAEGTITVDMVDRVTNQMIWEGTAIRRLSDSDLRNPDPSVSETINSIFNNYPFVAGQSAPVVAPAAQQ
ncbi:DUF4136 domain-containing protein [Thalassospira sp.]|uniref:DUF4136 domain-containing protein n=1 Tax=Thalassospira sp. TaxID=1912094 RepID=UPI002733A56E|nr:DUF4136 domain-containing protein [Thalassospira sp.]MDP2697606.1 DUF4136 domain-containing protein [Thalassospira sp.]